MKVSVIIPVYNVEKYVKKCIESVLQQNLDEYEIIIVNDGSTDQSAKIIQDLYEKNKDIIKIITQKNKGLGGARNTGIENAKGEYLFFLDSDDYIPAGTLQRLYERVKVEDLDILIFNALMVDEKNNDLGICKGCKNNSIFSLSTYPNLLSELPGAWNKIYKRSLFLENNIRYPDRVWYEDIHTTLKLYPYCKRISSIDEVHYYYLQREDSIMKSNKCSKVIEMCDAIQDVVDYYKENNLYDKYKNEIEYMAFLHEYMWSIRRVNLADWKNPVQVKLRDHYEGLFPQYKSNPFYDELDTNDKIFVKLIEKGCFGVLHLIYMYSECKKEYRRRHNDKK